MARTPVRISEEKVVTALCPVMGCNNTFTYLTWSKSEGHAEYCADHRNQYRRALAEKTAMATPMQAVA